MGVSTIRGKNYERGERRFEGPVEEGERLEVKHVDLSTLIQSFNPPYGTSYLVDEQHTRN